MTLEMAQKITGEELIEAFKTFGPSNELDMISKEKLKEELWISGEKI